MIYQINSFTAQNLAVTLPDGLYPPKVRQSEN
jgi:hypothetical protein